MNAKEKFVFLPESQPANGAVAQRIGLMGYVGDYSFSAEYLFPYLKAYKDEPIQLELYSFGGRLVEAFAILDYIQANDLDCTAYVFGFCGSAATVLASGCKATYMGENSFFFIHNSFNPFGEENEVNAMMDERMVEIYHVKTGQDKDQIREWMNLETTWSAQQAIEQGFADGLISDSDYMEQAAQFSLNLLHNNTTNTEMKFETFKAAWNKMFPGNSIEKPEEVEAKMQEVAEAKKAEPSAELTALQEKVDELTANLETLSSTMADAASVIAELKAGKQEAEQQTQEAEQQTSELAQSLQELRSQMNAIKAMKTAIPAPQPSAHAEIGERDAEEASEVLKAGSLKLPNKVFTHR